MVAQRRKRTVMLAQTYQPEIDPKGWWYSEKLDGIRGWWTGIELLSSTGMPLCPPDWWVERLPEVALDGELWGGRDLATRQAVKGICRRANGKGWERVGFWVFDAPESRGGFEDRLAAAAEAVKWVGCPWLVVLPHRPCEGRRHLQRELAGVESKGGEGLVLRRQASAYVRGARSAAVLKVKSWRDVDALVVGHEPGNGRLANRMGALLCELSTGVRFKVGTGFTDGQRSCPPPLGSWVNVGYFELTASGKPREPFFVGVRLAEVGT